MLDVEQLTDAEIGALAHALGDARFSGAGGDPMMWTSEAVITMHSLVLDEADRRLVGPRVDRWSDQFFQWSGRIERSLFMEQVVADPWLARWLLSGGAERVREILRPFVVDDDSISEILQLAATDPSE